jgi:imidazole glycerol-phosphate synthase subunit HisH
MMNKQRVVVIDYGVGNTHSISNAIEFLGYKVRISFDPNVIRAADVLILPGVGAFEEAMSNLRRRQLEPVLHDEVMVRRKPILGICVGMQMLATHSEENGHHRGLNWIPGRVVRFALPENYSVPHVGWNDIHFDRQGPLFARNAAHSNFFFDHSYHFECAPEHIAATCKYGLEVTAAVCKDNIFGVQFHPEKSQTSGLKLFRSFISSIA